MRDEGVRKQREAAQVILTLMRCIYMKHALAVTETDRLNFFRLYDGCLMDCAVIAWCKLFGGNTEKIHWSKLVAADKSGSSGNLQVELNSAAGGSLADLSIKIRNYRDTCVAHHDLDKSKRAVIHPMLGPLAATGLILYRHIREQLLSKGAAVNLPELLDERIIQTENLWREIAEASRQATKDFREA